MATTMGAVLGNLILSLGLSRGRTHLLESGAPPSARTFNYNIRQRSHRGWVEGVWIPACAEKLI